MAIKNNQKSQIARILTVCCVPRWSKELSGSPSLLTKAKSKGIDIDDICREAIYKVGCFRDADIVAKSEDRGSYRGCQVFHDHPNAIAFEKEISYRYA